MNVRKIALITGASRGLCRNAALKFAARGVDVIATYREGAAAAQALVGEAQDVDAVMVALLSNDMGWVNGQRVEASGGIHLRSSGAQTGSAERQARPACRRQFRPGPVPPPQLSAPPK